MKIRVILVIPPMDDRRRRWLTFNVKDPSLHDVRLDDIPLD